VKNHTTRERPSKIRLLSSGEFYKEELCLPTMGKIVELKVISNSTSQVTLEMTRKEFSWLKGSLDRMHLFSEENLLDETGIVTRGKKETSLYFLMPKPLKKGISISDAVSCTKISTTSREIFIFSVPKYE